MVASFCDSSAAGGEGLSGSRPAASPATSRGRPLGGSGECSFRPVARRSPRLLAPPRRQGLSKEVDAVDRYRGSEANPPAPFAFEYYDGMSNSHKGHALVNSKKYQCLIDKNLWLRASASGRPPAGAGCKPASAAVGWSGRRPGAAPARSPCAPAWTRSRPAIRCASQARRRAAARYRDGRGARRSSPSAPGRPSRRAA